MKYSTLIGIRYLKSKDFNVITLIKFLAIGGVSISVGILTTVTAITTGFEKEFQRKILGVNAHLLIIKYGFDFKEYREVEKKVRNIEGVVGVDPFMINRMMIVTNNKVAPVLAKGVDPQKMLEVLDLPNQIIEGSIEGLRIEGRCPAEEPQEELLEEREEIFLYGGKEEKGEEKIENLDEKLIDKAILDVIEEEEEPKKDKREDERNNLSVDDKLPGIVIGKTLAEDLNIKVGDTVKLISPISQLDTSLWKPLNKLPKYYNFKVIGIFYSGFYEYDTQLVYIDLYEEQRFYNKGDIVNGLEIKLKDPTLSKKIKKKVEALFKTAPYNIIDWEELNYGLFQALRLQKIAIVSVFAILVAVAGLLIISTLVMLIFEKKKEIAILKSMGSTEFEIMRIFLTVGTVVGVIGVVIGLVLGSCASLFLYYYGWPLDPEVYVIDHLPIEIQFQDYLIISGASFLACLFSTAIPSYFTAAKMNPLNGIRYE